MVDPLHSKLLKHLVYLGDITMHPKELYMHILMEEVLATRVKIFYSKFTEEWGPLK